MRQLLRRALSYTRDFGAAAVLKTLAIGRVGGVKKLARLMKKGLDLKEDCLPGSAEGRQALQFWFEISELAELEINKSCNSYYDGRHPKHYMWKEHNRYLVEAIRPGERVLDVGCGASHYQQSIARIASEVVGVDIRPERVAAARQQNSMANVRFELMDVTKDLLAERFDVAVCSHVIEHLDDPVAFLKALADVVPRLIVKVPLVDSHWQKLVKKDIGMFWLDDRDHRREYTEDLLREQLELSGWEVAEMIRGYDLRARATSTILKQPG